MERGKPAPDIYLEVADRLGVDPAGCIAIEDSDAGVLSASAADMLAVMVPDLKPPSPAAREAAFRVVASLHEMVPLLSQVGVPPQAAHTDAALSTSAAWQASESSLALPGHGQRRPRASRDW